MQPFLIRTFNPKTHAAHTFIAPIEKSDDALESEGCDTPHEESQHTEAQAAMG